MISRTYVVQMPGGGEAGHQLDILVQDDPGTQSDPVVLSSGAYYEVRGRALRIPVLAAAGASAGFVPRLQLGFSISVTPIGDTVTSIPAVQLSASLASLASTDTGPTIAIPAFADPNGQPAIRLTSDTDSDAGFFVVSLLISEQKDEDRDGAAAP
jgi:hypothetical protein